MIWLFILLFILVLACHLNSHLEISNLRDEIEDLRLDFLEGLE